VFRPTADRWKVLPLGKHTAKATICWRFDTSVQGEWKMNFPAAIGEIPLMKRTNVREMQLQRSAQSLRQERHALPQAFSIAHRDLVVTEVDVFDAQTHTLH